MIDWQLNAAIDERNVANVAQHICIITDSDHEQSLLFAANIATKLKRTQRTWQTVAKTPLTLETTEGQLVAICRVSVAFTPFVLLTQLRRALKPLLAEQPQTVAVVMQCQPSLKERVLRQFAWVLAVNAQIPKPMLPQKPSDPPAPPSALSTVHVFGHDRLPEAAGIDATALGNTLCRALTLTPPNYLTPALYQTWLQGHALQRQWQMEVWDIPALAQLGAGAFLAVAQGSPTPDAAIVKLSYRHPQATKTVALVGKGICFDTGGHNLKTSKHMLGMHQDMNGSAVAVGILEAVTLSQLPINVDCWLALAQNHIGPMAYKQNDVVTAMNGVTIEVVHTDAEGRMVLADTLALACQHTPDVLFDFATLTGSMQTALGARMSGIVCTPNDFAAQMVSVGEACGERVVVFPATEDYDEALESEVADIKQCTLDADADHILAARFLSRFVTPGLPWCHVDLSAYAHKGGLGAVETEVNGFGVRLVMQWLERTLGVMDV